MSHFSLFVVTPHEPLENKSDSPEEPTPGSLNAILLPWHEYECTDINKYLKEDVVVDFTEGDWTAEDIQEEIESWGATPRWDGPQRKIYPFVLIEGDKPIKIVRLTNPNDKWDWWTVGGRWAERWHTRDGSPLTSALKGDIDWNATLENGVTLLTFEWQKAQDTLAKAGLDWDGFKSWDDLVERGDSFDKVEAARKAYHAQPQAQALRDAGYWFGYDQYMMTLEVYLSKRLPEYTAPFAMVKDGEWHEKGEMGWFRCVSDEKGNWSDIYRELLESVPDDHWITIVDCHI